MDKEKLLALLLPGLSGRISFALNDQQLFFLVQELLQEKAHYIRGISSKDGYLQLDLNNPVVKKLDLKIVSLEISSTKLIVSLRILNILPLFLKPVIVLLSKIGFHGKMTDDVLVVDFSNKLQNLTVGLPQNIQDKLDHLIIEVFPQSGKIDVNISVKSL
ncbi:MAG: hypothetical protein RBS43_01150 [Candidatus Cloacimonas sp.]|jgi:hypothetical protein|nr:hypothetical protein [Candidatus Cloacimonas sp.]